VACNDPTARECGDPKSSPGELQEPNALDTGHLWTNGQSQHLQEGVRFMPGWVFMVEIPFETSLCGIKTRQNKDLQVLKDHLLPV